jgi:hypothetical protein
MNVTHPGQIERRLDSSGSRCSLADSLHAGRFNKGVEPMNISRSFGLQGAPQTGARSIQVSTAIGLVAALAVGCGAQPDGSNGSPAPETGSAGVSNSAQPGTQLGSHIATETQRVQSYLDSLYRATDVRHSFTTKFGEAVDCIDVDAHPSVKAARSAGLAVADQGPPVAPPTLPSPPAVDDTVAFAGQMDDDGNVRACPTGTVPYLRESAGRISAAGGLDNYLWNKTHQTPSKYPLPKSPSGPVCAANPPQDGYAWAVGKSSTSNLGGTTIAAVYTPGVTVGTNCGGFMQPTCEHSLAQVWATTGTCEYPSNCTTGASGNAVQSVELGWNIDNDVNGDDNTHLFTFSTQNGYNLNTNGGGCYNTCSFIPVSSPAYTPGQTISGVVYPGQAMAPLEYAFQVFNPGPTAPAYLQNWYVYVNGALIGYYLGSIFQGAMATHATSFEVGGEVFSDYLHAPNNDDVQMGSGFSPLGNGFTSVAYHRDIYTLNAGSGTGTICGNPLCVNGYCYSAMPLSGNTGLCGYQASTFYGLSTTDAPGGSQSSCWASYFYYGGGN